MSNGRVRNQRLSIPLTQANQRNKDTPYERALTKQEKYKSIGQDPSESILSIMTSQKKVSLMKISLKVSKTQNLLEFNTLNHLYYVESIHNSQKIK